MPDIKIQNKKADQGKPRSASVYKNEPEFSNSQKRMKFTMYEKESKIEKHRNEPYRAVNFPINEGGLPICPN